MSPIRTSAYGETMFVYDMGTMSPYTSVAHLGSSSSLSPVTTHTSERFHVPPISKKRRSPNAFILFRSHFIANKRVPPGIVHQNDVSRYVAEVWKSKLTPSERAIFFKMAQEEKVRFEIEGPREPAKKRRRRSNKARQSSLPKLTGDSCLPPSPTLASDISLATPGMSFSFLDASPQMYSSPNIYPTSPDYDGSVSLSAPQSTQAIPSSLLNWGIQRSTMLKATKNSLSLRSSTSRLQLPSLTLESRAMCLLWAWISMRYIFMFFRRAWTMAFTEFANPEFLFPASFETPF